MFGIEPYYAEYLVGRKWHSCRVVAIVKSEYEGFLYLIETCDLGESSLSTTDVVRKRL